jgi:hypothetical protein
MVAAQAKAQEGVWRINPNVRFGSFSTDPAGFVCRRCPVAPKATLNVSGDRLTGR